MKSATLPEAVDSYENVYHPKMLALLPEYVTAIVLEQPLTPFLSEIERHLEGCPVCRAEADALCTHFEALYSDALLTAPAAPSPDLSFLRAPPVSLSALTGAVDEVGEAVTRWLNAIVIQFSEALLPALQPAVLTRAVGPRLRYTYTVPPTSDNDPQITVEVLAVDEQADRGLVRLCVELLDADPFDQAGSTVILETAEQRFSAETDHAGLVHFADVPLDDIACWRIVVHPRRAPEVE